jgi:UDP-glucose 4-epimerase
VRSFDTDSVTWVIGAQGLLGSAVCRELVRFERRVVSHTIPWDDPPEAIAMLGAAARTLLAEHPSWRIAWCAGAGVIGTSQLQLDQEIEVLRGFLAELRESLAHGATGIASAQGALFVASSAGGVYAGSADPPFTEETATRSISPYGLAKLASEELAVEFFRLSGVPVLIGRIANLYGPGQDVSKPQGLVSQLCRAHLTRTPVSIYVSLDTARDYLYVDDAARMIVDGLERVRLDGGLQVKILASGRPTSVAAIIAELGRVTKRRPQIVLGASPNARYQARDLRFRSVVWPDLDAGPRTSLAAGISATLESLGQDLRLGHLGRASAEAAAHASRPGASPGNERRAQR